MGSLNSTRDYMSSRMRVAGGLGSRVASVPLLRGGGEDAFETEHQQPQIGQHFVDPSFESHDFDVSENKLYDEYIEAQPRGWLGQQRRLVWIIAAAIGVGTGVVAIAVDRFTYFLESTKFKTLGKMIDLYNKQPENDGIHVCFWVFVSFSVVYVLVATAMVAFVEPQAKGSGIPEVKAYLNGVQIPRVVRIKTLASKLVGVCFSVAGGMFVGKEGPMVHGGAIIAAGVSQMRGQGWNSRYLWSFRNDRDKRDFVSIGAACGMAGAFGAPIGGVLFSFEEASSHWNLDLTGQSFFAVMITAFMLRLSQAASGKHSSIVSFGSFEGPTSSSTGSGGYSMQRAYTFQDVVIFSFIGAIGGLAGALFNFINLRLSKVRNVTTNTRKRWRVLETLTLGLLTALTTFYVPYWWGIPSNSIDNSYAGQQGDYVGRCRTYESAIQFYVDRPSFPHFQNFNMSRYEWTEELVEKLVANRTVMELTRFFCPQGTYNEMATLFFSGMARAVEQLFHSPVRFEPVSLFVLFLIVFVVANLTYGINIPSGIFVPSFLIGALYGRIIGEILREIDPAGNHQPGSFALVGATSFLAGVSRMTIAVAVIMLETTNDITYSEPILLTVMIAKLVGDYFNEGLYAIHIHLKGLPLLETKASPVMYRLRASDIMTEHVVTLKEVESVQHVVDVLRNTTHNGFPIVKVPQASRHVESSLEGHFAGLISRSQLLTILKFKAFQAAVSRQSVSDPPSNSGSAVKDTGGERLTWFEFAHLYPKYPLESEVLPGLTSEDLSMNVNLTRFVNASADRVYHAVHLSRVFRSFRGMGLRHLPVVNSVNQVVGIITRFDFLTKVPTEENAEHLFSAETDADDGQR